MLLGLISLTRTFNVNKSKCLQSKRTDSDLVIKMRRISKGCGVMSDVPKVEIGRYGYHSCLCHEDFQLSSLGFLMEIYQNYEKGTYLSLEV